MSRLHVIQSLSKQNNGNVYSVTSMKLSYGRSKMLIALTDGKVYFVDCKEMSEDKVNPIIREVPFTSIPGGWDISSIDSFNRSREEVDDFYIGITVENNQINAEEVIESRLNIYSEPNLGAMFNIENIAKNCFSIELTFKPHFLKHTYLVEKTNETFKKELIWLIYGSDIKVHMYREEESKCVFFEDCTTLYFSEFSNIENVILWFDIKYTSDLSRRLTAIAYEENIYQIYSVDTSTNTVLHTLSEVVLQVVSRVEFFSLKPLVPDLPTEESITNILANAENEVINDVEITGEDIHLLVCLSLSPSVVYMNVDKGFHDVKILEESESNDVPLCACIADFNFDGCNEIILGCYGRKFMIYHLTKNGWELSHQMNAPGAVYGLIYADILGDGVNELVMSSLVGIHIFQHDLDDVLNVIMFKLNRRQVSDDDVDDGDDDDDDCPTAQKAKKLMFYEAEKEDMACEEVYEN